MTEETMTEEKFEEKGGSKKGLIIGGVILLLLLLAAAFVGGRLLAPQEEPIGPEFGMAVGLDGGVPPEGAETISMPRPEPAPELPATEPETMGLFVGRTDDTLTIGTGGVTVQMSNESGAMPEFSYDGIAVDVLVTNRTELYQDVTEFTPGQAVVQQKVEPLENLDDLQDNTTVQVWGRRDGGRIVAEVIVVMPPPQLVLQPGP